MGVEASSHTESESSLRHHCGVFGIFYTRGTDLRTAIRDTAKPFLKLQGRGQEGFGLVVKGANGSVFERKYSGLVRSNYDNLFLPSASDGGPVQLESPVVMELGQTRYSTSGSTDNDALQPFVGRHIVTIHNGNLTNPIDLATGLPELMSTDIYSDTHMMHCAIEAHIERGMSVEKAIQTVTTQAEGSFTAMFMSLDENAIYARTDPWLNRPGAIGTLNGNRGIIVASEQAAFGINARYERDLKRGECVRIDRNGFNTVFMDPRVDKVLQQSCLFELFYFSNPDGEVFGVPVGEYRRRTGARLAELDLQDGFVPDMINSIQFSGLYAGEGYAQGMLRGLMERGQLTPQMLSHLINQTGLLTNRYMGRAFIENEDRLVKAALKYSVDPRVRDNEVALVDDSMLRGDTLGTVIELYRMAGARRVHVRIASPPVRHPCPFGIDFSTHKELVAHQREIEEIRRYIGADTLRYLPLEDANGIAHALARGGRLGICNGCFTGNYYVPIDPNKMMLKQPH